ncbi:MAG TPA: hypothetical protein VIW94_07155 [Acidimicrobiia bacterium]
MSGSQTNVVGMELAPGKPKGLMRADITIGTDDAQAITVLLDR